MEGQNLSTKIDRETSSLIGQVRRRPNRGSHEGALWITHPSEWSAGWKATPRAARRKKRVAQCDRGESNWVASEGRESADTPASPEKTAADGRCRQPLPY